MPNLLYAHDLVLFGESEEDLRAMVRRLIDVCRRSLKVNASEGKVMVLFAGEG